MPTLQRLPVHIARQKRPVEVNVTTELDADTSRKKGRSRRRRAVKRTGLGRKVSIGSLSGYTMRVLYGAARS
jgi:hypothetical protein